jgi:hypothetical protein
MAQSISTARRGFRIWRRTRPFWGGLLVICGAGEILLSEQGPLSLVIHIGIQGLAGYLIPVMLLLCGVLLWFSPAQRPFYSLLAIVLALGSWVTSNLGGFFIGMLLGIVGAALAFAWATDPDEKPLRWFRGNPQVLQPSWGAELVLRPTATLPPPRRVLGSIESGGTTYWSAISPSQWARLVVGISDSYAREFATTIPGGFGADAAMAERAYGRVTPQSEIALSGLHQLACCLGEAAGQRGVDRESVREVIDAQAPLDRQRDTQNQLAGPRCDDDATEDGPAAAPGDQLDEPIPEGLHLRPGVGS